MEQLLASGHCEKAVEGHCLGAPILNISRGMFLVGCTIKGVSSGIRNGFLVTTIRLNRDLYLFLRASALANIS